ncbi:MAG TPA: hypothetical protein VIM11_19300 [Tepidisphaeraceae bacterium]|jgi:hypothetical protein
MQSMSSLSIKAKQLRDRIISRLNAGAPSNAETTRWSESVAGLVLTALEDKTHPVSTDLLNLQAFIEEQRRLCATQNAPSQKQDKTNVASESGLAPLAEIPSERNLFLPLPGTQMRQLQEFWPLQLLLYSTANSSRSETLAERLGLTHQKLRGAVEKAGAISVKFWGPLQYANYLAQALGSLEAEVAETVPRIEGRVLTYNGNGVRLSAQQAMLAKLLIDRAGQRVSFEKFVSAGVPHPARIKLTLVQKLAKVGIELNIQMATSSYTLHPRD